VNFYRMASLTRLVGEFLLKTLSKILEISM
jgi:hypothetical protein